MTLLANPPSLVILDLEAALIHPSELARPEVYVPKSVAHFLEADVLAGQRVGDADPVSVPPNAAVAADEADFEVPRVL